MRALSRLAEAGSLLWPPLREQLRRGVGRSNGEAVRVTYGSDVGDVDSATLRHASALDVVFDAPSDDGTGSRAAGVLACVDLMPRLRTARLLVATDAEVADDVARLETRLMERGCSVAVAFAIDGVLAAADVAQPDVWQGLTESVAALSRHGLEPGVTFTVSAANGHWADDVLRWCDLNGVDDHTFVPDASLLETPIGRRDEPWPAGAARFHACMFFDRLTREKTIPLEKRLYYRRVADRIEQGVAGPRTDGLVTAAGEVLPAGADLARLGGRILSAKAGSLTRRAPAEPSYDLTPTSPDTASPNDWQHVLITGWYGTETQGDKAILGELLSFIRRRAPGCRVTVSTIYPKISSQTAVELGDFEQATMLDIARCAEPAVIESVDAVIFGGGPLMESASMRDVWRIFAEANRQRKARVLFGCGVGPTHTDEVRRLTASILGMTTSGFLRDAESHELAGQLSPDHVLHFACDPAVAFVHRWRQSHAPAAVDDSRRIAALLRANTSEFKAGASRADVDLANARAAERLAGVLEPAAAALDARVELLHMNAHWVGGDDRLFNRLVAGFMTDATRVNTVRRYLPLEQHLEALARADIAVAMRYHGHIFCMALGIPFLSVDYTGSRGKVASLVRRIGYDEWSQEWERIDVGDASARLERLMEERGHWSDYLLSRTDELVALLDRTYEAAFGRAEHAVAGTRLSP